MLTPRGTTWYWFAILGLLVGTAKAQIPALIEAPILSPGHLVGTSSFITTEGGPGTLADVDGDGDADLVVFSINTLNLGQAPPNRSAQLTFRVNNGSGTFGGGPGISIIAFPAPLNSPTPRTILMRPANLNGDNREDIVVVTDQQIRGFLSNGTTAAPSLLFTINAAFGVNHLAVADFDGNGLDDMALGLVSLGVDLHFVQTGGTLTSFVNAASVVGLNGLASLDGNADGIADLAYVDVLGTGRVAAFLGGVLTQVATWNYPNTGLRGVAAGDIDNDGDQDIVGTLLNFSSVPARLDHYVVRQGPAGLFTASPSVAFGAPSNSQTQLILGDDDGDGDLDFSISSNGSMFTARNTAGVFGSALQGYPASGSTLPEVRNVDGAGGADVLFGGRLYFGAGTRGWASEVTVISTGLAGQVLVGDLDGDGDVDVGPGVAMVTPTNPGAYSSPYLNDGTGTFTLSAPVVFGTPAGLIYMPGGLAIDADSDGNLDLIVDTFTPGTLTTSNRLLWNRGGGSYTDQGIALPGVNSIGYFQNRDLARVLGDLNGDGRPDLALLRPSTTTATLTTDLWFSTVAGAFVPGPTFVGYDIRAAADFTNDGIADLLVVADSFGGQGPYSVLMVPGLGMGAFANPFFSVVLSPAQSFGSGVEWNVAVAAGDIEGDGDADVLLSRAGEIRICTNIGAGQFQFVVMPSPPGNVNPTRAWIEDLNGDAILDLSVGGVGFWSVSLRQPSQFPSSPGIVPGPIQAYGITPGAIADLDGDGDVDVISADNLVGPATTLPAGRMARGRTFSGPSAGQIQQYGAPLAGAAGTIPVLGLGPAARISTNVALNLTNGVGGSATMLVMGTSAAATPALGGIINLVPTLLLPLTLGGGSGVIGGGTLTIPGTLAPGLQGTDLFFQAGCADPAAPSGVTLTRGLRVRPGI